MKFTIDTEAALKSLIPLAKVIPSRPSLPILSNFLFELDGDSLRITAADGELTLATVMKAEATEGSGGAAVPAKIFMDLLRTLPQGGFTAEIEPGKGMTCSWESGRSTLPVFPAEDYPAACWPEPGAEKTVTMNGEDLSAGIAKTSFAVAHDGIRPVFGGLFFDIDPEGSSIVATDTHKLVCQNISTPGADKGSFVLASRAARILREVVDREEALSVSYDDRCVCFRSGSSELLSVLIAGKFPPYRGVIPAENENVLSVGKATLLGVLRRMCVCADQRSSVIKVRLSFNEMTLSAQDLSMATSATEKLECDYDGDEMEIGFKGPFFIETVGSMEAENIEIRFKEPKKAVLLQPSAEERMNEPYEAVLMPVLVA